MSNLIDAHCHLDLFENIQQIANQEDNTGIKSITVTNSPSFYLPNTDLFGKCKNIRVGLGLHPQLIKQGYAEFATFEKLIHETRYIGEVGLDGSKEIKETFPIQKNTLERILQIATSLGNKVLTVHSKNAAKDTIELLKRYTLDSTCRIILHWYTGSLADLKIATAANFYFSVNHKMVNSDKGKEIIKSIPAHLLLTETDAPFTFTATIKSRLQSLNSTIASLAFQKNKHPDEIKELVSDNFKRLLS